MAAPNKKAPSAETSTPPASACGSPGSAFGAAVAALALNLGVGLISGLAATLAAATAGPPQGARTPMQLAEAARRGIVAGATVHGAITTAVGLMTAESHPHFAGAATYIGVSALGTAALGTMIPLEALARIESSNLPSGANSGLPVGGIPDISSSPQATTSPVPIDAARGLPLYGGPAIDPLRLAGAPVIRRTAIDAILPRR